MIVFFVVFPDIFAIDQDAPGAGFVKTAEQFDQRALAGSVLTNQRKFFAGRDVEVEILQDGRGRVWIDESQVLDNNFGNSVIRGGVLFADGLQLLDMFFRAGA